LSGKPLALPYLTILGLEYPNPVLSGSEVTKPTANRQHLHIRRPIAVAD
jgi:hypothetical protein